MIHYEDYEKLLVGRVTLLEEEELPCERHTCEGLSCRFSREAFFVKDFLLNINDHRRLDEARRLDGS